MGKIYGIEDKKLSDNFWLSEFLRSGVADARKIKNTPNSEQLKVIEWVAKNVAQPIRDDIGSSLNLTSGFRNPAVNKLAGGVSDSYHAYNNGTFAFDCHAPKLSLTELLEKVMALNLPITKAIIEIDQGILHIQGHITQFLVRDVINGKKVYVFYDQFKKTGHVA